MSVVKGKRQPSNFEVFDHFSSTRKDITEYLISNFKYNKEKTLQRLQHKCGINDLDDPDITEAKLQHYDSEVRKEEEFISWFIPSEREVIMDYLREIDADIRNANKITIENRETLLKRRGLQTRAIAMLESIEVEFNAVAEMLPINLNRVMPLVEAIDHEKKLISGWKSSDKKYARKKGIYIDDIIKVDREDKMDEQPPF